MPGLQDLLQNPRRLRQFAETPGNYPAALDAAASQGRMGRRSYARPRSSASSEKDDEGTLSTGDVIDSVQLPDGSVVPPASPSGRLVKVPGRSNIYVDPVTREPYKPDPTQPTGLRSAWADASRRRKDGKIVEVIPGVAEREIGPDPVVQQKEEQAKLKAEQAQVGEKYWKEGRPYMRNPATGMVVPRNSDEEWEKAKAEKGAKLLEDARVKKLRAHAEKLDIEADRIKLNTPKVSTDEESAYDAATAELQNFANGEDLDTAAERLAREGDDIAKGTADTYLSLRNKVKPAKEAAAKVKELELRALDLKEQMLDPAAWKEGKAASLKDLDDDALEDEAKAQAEIATEQEQEATARLEAIDRNRKPLTDKLDGFLAARKDAEAKGLSVSEQKMLDDEQAQIEQDIHDYNDAHSEAQAESQAGLTAAADRKEVLGAAANEITARNEAKAKAADDMQKEAVVMDRAKQAYMAIKDELNVDGLDGWLVDKMAKEQAVAPEDFRRGLQTMRELDWSKPRINRMTLKPIEEKSRTLPNGSITVNPKFWGDADAYKTAVEASAAKPEARKKALEAFPKLQEIHAEKAVEILSQSANIPGADNFMKWRERKIEESQAKKGEDGFTRLTPGRQAIQYMEEMKGRSWFRKAADQVASGLLAGFQDIATQVLGVAAGVTTSETLSDLAAANAANTQSVVGAQSLEGSDTDYALRVMGMGSRMAPAVAAMIAGAGAVGGGLTAGAVLGGMQTAGSMYADLYRQAKDQGSSHSDAWKNAAIPAALAGTITSLLTKGMGATGLERVFADPATQQAARSAFRGYLAQFSKGALEEIPEEVADEYFSQLIQGAAQSADPVATLQSFASGLPELTGVTALMGGAGGLMQRTAPGSEAGESGMAPMPEGPVQMPTEPRALNEASAPMEQGKQDEIAAMVKDFTPSGATPLPQSVQVASKKTGRPVDVVARQAASAVLKVAKGAGVDQLDLQEQQALGFTNKDGSVKPEAKVTPLVYFYKDQPVITNAAAEWLTDEGQEGLAGEIALDETTRKQQIDQQATAQAQAEAERLAGEEKAKADAIAAKEQEARKAILAKEQEKKATEKAKEETKLTIAQAKAQAIVEKARIVTAQKEAARVAKEQADADKSATKLRLIAEREAAKRAERLAKEEAAAKKQAARQAALDAKAKKKQPATAEAPKPAEATPEPAPAASIQALQDYAAEITKPARKSNARAEAAPLADAQASQPPALSPAQAARATPAQKARAAKKMQAPVDAAAHQAATSPVNSLPEPTHAQKEAGNYQKGHVKIGGLDISIENPAGSKRQPKWGTLADHYGYIKGTVDNTGEHVDVFVRPSTPENYDGPVYMVSQVDPKTGNFDEFKVILGYPSQAEAEAAYRANYTKDWKGFGGIQEMSMADFKSGIAKFTSQQKAEAARPPGGQAEGAGEGNVAPEGGSIPPASATSLPQAQPKASPKEGPPLAQAQAVLADVERRAVAAKSAPKASQKDKNTASRQILAARRLAGQLAKLEGVVEYQIATAYMGNPIQAMIVIPAGNGSILAINPEGLVNEFAERNLSQDAINKGLDKFLVHEFIHQAALATIPDKRIVELYNALTPEAKDASRNLYLANAGENPPALNEFQAAHEWFAQLVEARMTGEISNQGLIEASENPAFRDKLVALLRDFIAKLRDIAALVKDPAMARAIQAEADAVQAAVETLAAKAGLEVRQEGGRADKKVGPPSLGDTGKAIWQGWKSLKGMDVMPDEVVVGVDVHNGGVYSWSGDELMKSTTNAKQGYALMRPATKAEIEELHDSIDRGALQIEARKKTGATGMFPKVNGGQSSTVYHQATGKPLAEFLDTPAGKAWQKRDAETQAIIKKLHARQPEAPPVTAKPPAEGQAESTEDGPPVNYKALEEEYRQAATAEATDGYRDWPASLVEGTPRWWAVERNTVTEDHIKSAQKTADNWEVPVYIGKRGETMTTASGEIGVSKTKQPVVLATVYPDGKVELGKGAWRRRPAPPVTAQQAPAPPPAEQAAQASQPVEAAAPMGQAAAAATITKEQAEEVLKDSTLKDRPIKTYEMAVAANQIHMGTKISDWSAFPFTGEAQDGKPTQDLTGASEMQKAPTLFPSSNAQEHGNCEWCGKQPVKNFYFIKDDGKKWTLAVGSECITHFAEKSGDEMAGEARQSLALATIQGITEARKTLSKEFSEIQSAGYGRTERVWKNPSARTLNDETPDILGKITIESGAAAHSRWLNTKLETAREWLARYAELMARPETKKRQIEWRARRIKEIEISLKLKNKPEWELASLEKKLEELRGEKAAMEGTAATPPPTVPTAADEIAARQRVEAARIKADDATAKREAAEAAQAEPEEALPSSVTPAQAEAVAEEAAMPYASPLAQFVGEWLGMNASQQSRVDMPQRVIRLAVNQADTEAVMQLVQDVGTKSADGQLIFNTPHQKVYNELREALRYTLRKGMGTEKDKVSTQLAALPDLTPPQTAAVAKEVAMPEPAKQVAPFDSAAAKGQKKVLLAGVAEAAKAAPKRADMSKEQKDAISELETQASRNWDSLREEQIEAYKGEYAAAKANAERLIGYVTIEVPGDGTFTILNEKIALAQFQKRADKFPVSQAKDSLPAKPTAQAPTAVPALKKPKTTADVVAAMFPMVSESSTRGEAITKVTGDGTHLFATDGRVLVRVKQENGGGKGREIALYDEKGAAMPLPDGEKGYDGNAVIPDDKKFTPYILDTARWFSLMSQARAVIKTLPGENDRAASNSVAIYRNPDDSLGIFASDVERGDYTHNIQPNAKFLASYDPEYMQTIFRVARNLGHEQVEMRINDDISPATFHAGNAVFVLMSMRLNGAAAYSPDAKRPKPPVTTKSIQAESSPATQQPTRIEVAPPLASPPGQSVTPSEADQAADLERAVAEAMQADEPAVNARQDLAETAEEMDAIRKDAEAREDLRNDPDAIAALQRQGAMSARNLSKQFTTPSARAFYQALTAARDAVGGPETVVFEELRKWALQRLESDPQGAIEYATDLADQKAMLTPEQQAVVAAVIEHLNREVAMTGDKGRRILLTRLGNYYLDVGTAAAQVLAARRDPLETPQDRWNKALSVVFGPDAPTRRRLRLAPSEAAKARQIADLEAQLADYKGNRRADIEAALEEVKKAETQEAILEKEDAKNEKLKDSILDKMGVTEQDVKLPTVDRLSLQAAILDLPAVREALDKYKNGRDIMRLAFRGFSDRHIANALRLNEADVSKFITAARNAIIKPAVVEQVKAGNGFAGLIRSGLESLAKRVGLRAPSTGPLNSQSPPLAPGTQANIMAEVDNILNFALQPAARRNKAGRLISKVVTTPAGQKVRVFVPFDPDDMASFYSFARTFATAKAGYFDKLYEYWINWPLLSGPQTQVANITGNAAQVAWHYTGQRMAEAALNLAYRDPNSAQLGEFKHLFKAFVSSIMPSVDMARQAFLTEGDSVRHKYLGEPMEIEFKDGSLDKVGAYRPSVGGKLGRINRLPGRMLRLADAFFKTSILYMEVTTLAYRSAVKQAKDKGLTGAARSSFIESTIANAVNNPGSAVWQKANSTAEELLFQDDNAATDLVDTILGGNKSITELEKGLAEAELKGDFEAATKQRTRIFWRKTWGKIMRLLFPFQRTPTNIIKTGLRKAGGAALAGLWHGGRAGFFKVKDGKPFVESYTKAMQIKDISESLVAGLGWLVLSSMFEGGDDDEKKPILIVGNRPNTPGSTGEREAFLRQNGGANSFVFRDKDGKVTSTFNFSRYEPVATLLSALVDGYRNYKEVARRQAQGDTSASFPLYLGSSLLASVEGKSFLQGVSGVMETIRKIEERKTNPDPNWVSKMLLNSVVPNIIKQPLRNWDDLIRESKTAGVGYTALPNPEIAPKTPDFAAQPKITTTGEQIRKSGTGLSRLLFQANPQVTPQPDAFLLRANRLNPAAAWYPQPLQKDDYYVRVPGAKRGTPGYHAVITDPEKQRQFAERRGRLYAQAAKDYASRLPPAKRANPGPAEIEGLKKVAEDAREKARVLGGIQNLHKPSRPANTTPPR